MYFWACERAANKCKFSRYNIAEISTNVTLNKKKGADLLYKPCILLCFYIYVFFYIYMYFGHVNEQQIYTRMEM